MKVTTDKLCITVITLSLFVLFIASVQGSDYPFGSVYKPFSADSPWNSRPVNPKFAADVTIPTSKYYPNIDSGTYSVGIFEALPTDQPMTVYSYPTQEGIADNDIGGYLQSLTIPRWPEKALPATGGDGHCDIYDTTVNIVHSFWQLKRVNGTWRAAFYAWTKVDGTGWGDPAHYYQGARAAAVPPSGGILRTHEINDGDSMYRHVLAMSLDFSGLSPNPAYVFPATHADYGASWKNYGKIPEGALVMLPSTFDTSKIVTPKLKKVVETLKVYGARVVDQNDGTPFALYAEIGSNYTLHPGGWNNNAAQDLQTMRAALRMVESVDGWLNGNGQPVTFTTNQNIVSMRGPWTKLFGTGKNGAFNTYRQAVVFPPNNATFSRTVMANANGNGFGQVYWAKPVAGQMYNMTAVTTGGGQARLLFVLDCVNQGNTSGTPYLNNGQSSVFVWPAKYCYAQLLAASGTALNQESSASCIILKVETPSTPQASSSIPSKDVPAANSTNPLKPSPTSQPGKSTVVGEDKNSLASRQVVGLVCLLSVLLTLFL